MSLSRLSEAMLNMVTIRNLIRSAGTSLSYWPPHINGHVVWWMLSCVQDNFQENTNTALQKEDTRAQRPKFNRHKNRNNSRTTGFNLFGGKRSIYSTLRIREGIQANMPLVYFHRSFSQKILSTNLHERVLIMEMQQWIEKCKNKDGRYGNLIHIIGAPFTLKTAYLMIKNNPGISAKGVNDETLDGISLKTIQKISKDVLSGNFKVKPVRRVMIPKPGKEELRLLGVSSPREKIVQKAIEMVLTTIFEEVFLDCSHGFRPGRSCHTALKQLQLKTGNASSYSWVIEGDIKGCFDNIPHNMIIKGISRRVDCPATLNLIKKILNAGYVLDSELKNRKSKAKVFRSDVGTPQGTVLSPLFSNIVLHELDRFIEDDLRPKYSRGKQRKANLEYRKLRYRIKLEPDKKKKKKLINECLKVPSKDFHDANFTRLHYIRYADDWLILLAGSYKDAVIIRKMVSDKLQTLGLTLNFDKTQITSLRNGKARFLGVTFFIRKTTDTHFKPIRLIKKKTTIRQRFAPRIILQAPILELLIKLKNLGFAKRSSKGEFFPIGKTNCIPLTHPQILNYYNSKIRGTLNYYSCVHNRNELWSIVRILHYSCALTLARKFKLKSLKKAFSNFGKDLKFVNEKGKKYSIFRPNNLRMLPIDKRFNTKMNKNIDELLRQTWSNSLTRSQFDEACAICGTTENLEIHHIRSVKNVRVKTRTYAQWIGGFERKTIPLCKEHHINYHSRKLSRAEIVKLSKYKGKKFK
jgi:group II intron reverse transcriptase/maturase